MLLSSYTLSLLHQQSSETLPVIRTTGHINLEESYLVLELRWIPPVYRHSGPVNMQLPHDTTSTLVPFFPDKFRPECSLLRAHPETKESYEDISFWIFI
jgi:hypothetical protein